MTSQPNWTTFALQRPNYFGGQYLLDQDFELAHRYLSDRQRYINSRLHLAGIVEGLTIEPGETPTTVTIQPGSAIDGEGHLIIVPTPMSHAVTSAGWLCLRYHQEPKLLQQSEIPDSFTRFEESPLITLEAIQTQDAKTITLAYLTPALERVEIDDRVRQYAGIRLPGEATDLMLQNQAGTLTIQGQLSIFGNLQLGDVTITGISQRIDSTAPRLDALPSEPAVKTLIESRLGDHLKKVKKLTAQEKPTINTSPGTDGKLYGWQTTGDENVADPSAQIKLFAYQAGERSLRVSLERDDGDVEINGSLRVQHVQLSNPMRHRMYPANPEVYQDIFEARDRGKITPIDTPENYNDTKHFTNLWSKRRVICFGALDKRNRGALIDIPPGYDTVWIRFAGDLLYEFKADMIDGAREKLGYWTAGRRNATCYCPDGSLTDSYGWAHQWVAIPTRRSGKLRLVNEYNAHNNHQQGTVAGLWISGLAFSRNPWAHATQGAFGYIWASNDGTATGYNAPNDSGNRSKGIRGDIYSYLVEGIQTELRVPYVWSGRDKLLYFGLDNAGWNNTSHGSITVNGTPIERLLSTYDNPFARHWNSRFHDRYIAARIPAELIPKPTADTPPLLKVKIDRTLQDENIYFREIGTHDLEVPEYPH